MKKIVYFMMAAAIALVSCKKTEDKINDVQVSLTKGGEAFAVENVEVSLRSSANATVYTALTDANGVAVFQMKAGAHYIRTLTFITEQILPLLLQMELRTLSNWIW